MAIINRVIYGLLNSLRTLGSRVSGNHSFWITDYRLPSRALVLRALALAAALAALLAPASYFNSKSPAAVAVDAVQGDDHFGVDWINPPGAAANATRMRQAIDLGARWDRFPLYWNQMQPNENGPIDFSQMDADVTNDVSNGLNVQGILLGAPQWAMSGGRVIPDKWYQFVYQTALHYKGRVSYWEMWNEPDMLDANGKGLFWQGSIDDYYDLLKAGYSAVKAANPDAKVLLGALAFPYNDQDFFPKLLDVMARDSTAPANNDYFDILPLHLYGRVSTFYDLPIGYVGQPDFAGFRNLMLAKGFEKPIWVNEAGVGVWDTGSGQKAPGRATMDEDASFVIEAFAYGLVSGIDKTFIFQLYDDGAGARDASGAPVEYYGLVSNTGVPRPAYTAYQTAARYFSGTKLATRVNFGRNGSADVKGVDVVTLYGTPVGKITLVWNNDGGTIKQVRVLSNSASAVTMDKMGRQQPISPSSGAYVLNVAPAANANNFDCFTSSGCDPNDFIIGGAPTMLIENDYSIPPATINPLPSGVNAPFNVSWQTTKSVPGASFDLQYMDPDNGVWRDWLVGTTATSGTFGASDTPAQKNHTYVFRVRVHDAAGNLVDSEDYPLNGMASTAVLGGTTTTAPLPSPTAAPVASPTPSPAAGPVDAKIQIVWPQGNKPVTEAIKVNVGGYLFLANTLTAVNLNWLAPIKLWQSLNNGVEREVAVGQKRTEILKGLAYPVWDFNDIDVSQARDPLNKYYFRLSVDGVPSFGNIWSHGADGRTYFPNPDVPAGLDIGAPTAVDAKIEIVWPHGNLSVDKASEVNVGVDLFGKGTLRSVPLDYNPTVRLWRALNNESMVQVAVGAKETKTDNGITYPVWTFNDVDVSAAQDPKHKYYFRVTIDGVPTYSNIWCHGKDARTLLPTPEQPSGVSGN